MKNREQNKKEIKIYFLLLLVIMTICGAVGYGVYSYYWSKADISIGTESAYMANYNPEAAGFDKEQYYSFAGNETTTEWTYLECPEDLDPSTTNTCFAYAYFRNVGDTAAKFELSNFEKSLDQYHSGDSSITWKTSDFRISTSEFTLAPNEKQSVRIEVDIYTDDEITDGESGIEVDDEVDFDEEVYLYMNFDISTRQIFE